MKTGPCERGGFLRVWSDNRSSAKRLACKTWGCLKCSNQNLLNFKSLVNEGCFQLGPFVFITLTLLRRQGVVLKRAPYAWAVWRLFIRRLKEIPKYRDSEWVMVPELTEAGQPHLHLILSVSWSDGSKRMAKRINREVRKVWRKVTGDSYVVWTTPVVGTRGPGGYLAKYMAKDMVEREALEAAGFHRRFSRSRGWPKFTYRLIGSGANMWSYERAGRGVPKVELENGLEASAFDLRAEPLAMEALERSKIASEARKAKRMKDVLINIP